MCAANWPCSLWANRSIAEQTFHWVKSRHAEMSWSRPPSPIAKNVSALVAASALIEKMSSAKRYERPSAQEL
jgi:hypothetical protein